MELRPLLRRCVGLIVCPWALLLLTGSLLLPVRNDLDWLSLESQTCLVSSLNVSTYPACENWGCKVLDWFNSPIYRLATTLWRTVLLPQNAKMGKKWHLISDCDLSRFGAWCLLGPATTTLDPLNLQEPAVRPTVFSDRDPSCFPKKVSIYLIYLSYYYL